MARIVFMCFIFGGISKTDTARILAVFPVPSISHQIVFRPLTQELARRGHDVTVITPDPAFPSNQAPPNLTEIDVHNVSYSIWHELLKGIAAETDIRVDTQLQMFFRSYPVVFEAQLKTNDVQDKVLNTSLHFDLILGEACVRTALIFSHVLKSPFIQISSLGATIDTNSIVGAPNHPIFQPLVRRQRIYNLTFWEKIGEIYNQFKLEHSFYELEDEQNELLQRIFSPTVPTITELYNNVDLVFLNVHPIWNDNQSVPPNVIFIGGLHLNPAKELPKDLKSYLDASKNGIIYVSFGTNVKPSMLPPQKIKVMIKVFSEMAYDVIWKWDTNLPNITSNIKVFKWLPQSDLLRHPKVKAFVTQGGLQSTDEAIDAGVPLIGIPVIADQWYNTEKYIRHGIGVKLDLGMLTEGDFKKAIVTVIEDISYRDNIVRLRALMRDQSQSPLERAVWWVEHALQHGGARHLRAPAANMTWTQYYQLDLVLIVLACLLSVILVTCVSLYCLQRYIRNNIICKIKLKVV